MEKREKMKGGADRGERGGLQGWRIGEGEKESVRVLWFKRLRISS